MTNEEMLNKRRFAVVGDTINSEKYAYRIKNALLENGYDVASVGKELKSIDDIEGEIDVLDLCINPIKGLSLLKETKKEIPFVLIQPGAGSEDIERYLTEKGIPFRNGCVLKALEERR